MRAVVQRVTRASVAVGDERIAAIGPGLLVLVGVEVGDGEKDADWIADKVRTLRIFPDNSGVMNRSVEESNGQILAVSQFTLLGDARRGRRPSYIRAAGHEEGEALYRRVVETLRRSGADICQGIFRADMQVELTNDGPVTILLDSHKDL